MLQQQAPASINGLTSVEDVAKMISAGKVLLLAGDESLLSKLPAGRWIGGTSANFMTSSGGTTDREHVFFTDISELAADAEAYSYSSDELPNIGNKVPANGFTVIIVPGLSDIHATFAKEVQTYDGIFNSALVGWISGVHVSEIGKRAPKSFAGSGVPHTDRAAVLYVTLPEGSHARLEIINSFTPGDGAVIEFRADGFSTDGNCLINGEPANLAAHLAQQNIDTKLPLVADYSGAMINVSIQSVDTQAGRVNFYAPVFRDIQYRFASPVSDYTAKFNSYREKTQLGSVAFSCNCILNFLYADLEGKTTGSLVGPVTFGEIAYMLLNQTLVCLSIETS